MFLLNLGYKWNLTSLDGLRGTVILPQSNSFNRLSREHPGEFQTLLLDPQLYLSSLKVEHRTKICARLSAYPWFNIPNVGVFNSGEQKRIEWEKAVREKIRELWLGHSPEDLDRAALTAVGFQAELGCTSIILPAPLVNEREDEGSTLGDWIDAGLEACDEFEIAQPVLATVAISDSTLNESAFNQGGFLESVVDQITARNGVDGVYIVIAQTETPVHPFEISDKVAHAYLHLVKEFFRCNIKSIVTNFSDLIGFVSLGIGATAFASGQSFALRSLNIEGFRDEGGGTPLPSFYSHKIAAEYRTESDLKKIIDHRLFRRIADETEASQSLMEALRSGRSASDLPSWAESHNNLHAAHSHFIERLIIEGNRLKKIRPNERYETIVNWLESAEANALYVHNKIGINKLGRRPKLDYWRQVIEEIEGT